MSDAEIIAVIVTLAVCSWFFDHFHRRRKER